MFKFVDIFFKIGMLPSLNILTSPCPPINLSPHQLVPPSTCPPSTCPPINLSPHQLVPPLLVPPITSSPHLPNSRLDF